MEPVPVGSNLYVCTHCEVGYYKPYEGSDSCKKCPIGADCLDVGIIVPCILEGYWRQEPPLGEEGDFSKYKIYACYDTEGCRGGCYLNASCAEDRVQSSPVCAVCASGYYMRQRECMQCDERSKDMTTIVTAFVVQVVVLAVGISYLFRRIVPGIKAEETAGESYLQRIFKSSRTNTSSIDSSIGYLVNSSEKILPRTAMTAKLTLSFVQVMSKSFYALPLNWPHNLGQLLHTFGYNPLDNLEAGTSCAQAELTNTADTRLVMLFSTPLSVLFLLFACFYGVYYWDIVPRANSRGVEWVQAARQSMFNMGLKIYIWACLIIYPQVSAM